MEDEKKKLTIEEMNAYDMYQDVAEVLAAKRGVQYEGRFVRGLPYGLKLPGVTVGVDTTVTQSL